MCGVDPNLSYYKIQYASMCLLHNPGCLFIATNADSRGHFTPNQEWAGAGATVGAIRGVGYCSTHALSSTAPASFENTNRSVVLAVDDALECTIKQRLTAASCCLTDVAACSCD